MSINPDSTQFTTPVHQGWSPEVGDVDRLSDLPLQAVVVDPRHPHCIPHVSPIMVVVTVQLQHLHVLVLRQLVEQVLPTSGERIFPSLAKVLFKPFQYFQMFPSSSVISGFRVCFQQLY